MNRIAILLNTSWYIYNFRRNLISELIKNNYEVIAIAPYDEYSNRLEQLGCKYFKLEINSKSKNPIYDLMLLFRIRLLLEKNSPDLLLNFTIKPNVYGSLAARSLGIKCINNVAGMGTLFTEGFISRTILKFLFKISQLKAHTVFFQNIDDYNELTINNIVNKDICKLIPGSGVNLLDFPFSPIHSKHKDKLVFILIARMIRSKGVVELVEAGLQLAKKGYTNFRINLLGELGINNPNAITKSEMDDLCLNLFVSYLGKTDDVKYFIHNSDVVVLPSYYREGTPKSLLEALSTGRPIITTDMPGCRDTVLHGVNGFLCKPKSVQDLTEKMEAMLLMSAEDRKKMGKSSRKIAEEKYDERIVIDHYFEQIEKALRIK
ncbi:MAG: glycosyltransferase family 4 protein [Chitinispirillaceae bacterium]|nr:glycosyltransferase family 4 protein [Chitinispirillaceae bacterium]